MMKSQMSRNINVDVIKGIAIILMVYGHTNGVFKNFVYLFHVPVFFIASGYCFNSKHIESLKSLFNYIVKKIKSLYIPFVVINIVFVLLNNIFLNTHIFTDNSNYISNTFSSNISLHYYATTKDTFLGIISSIVFGTSSEFGSATWFLRCLFFVTIAHAILRFIIKNIPKVLQIIIQGLVLCLCCAMAVIIDIYNVHIPLVSQCFIAYVLYYIGIALRKNNMPSLARYKAIFCFIISFTILLLINNFQVVDIADGKIGNIFHVYHPCKEQFLTG